MHKVLIVGISRMFTAYQMRYTHTPLNSHSNLWGSYYYSHFIAEKAETQKDCYFPEDRKLGGEETFKQSRTPELAPPTPSEMFP